MLFSLRGRKLAAAWATACLAGVCAGEAGASEPPKLVLGHQMTVLPRAGRDSPVSVMRQEIKQWKDLGLDGTLLFESGGGNAEGAQLQDIVRRYYQAGVAEEYRFAVSTTYFTREEVEHFGDFIASLSEKKFAGAQLLVDGRVFVSAFHASSAFPQLIDYLRTKRKIETYAEPFVYCRAFIPFLHGGGWESGKITDANPGSYATLMEHPEWRAMDGFAAFEVSPSILEQADKTRWIWAAAKKHRKSARGSIVAYYKGLAHKGNPMVYEGWGYTRLRETWRAAIDSGLPHVELITLNDLSESSYFNSWAEDDPVIITNHWASSDNPALLDHSGFRYFSKRYVQWFRTGTEPPIERDELFYAYRLHPRDATDYARLPEAERKALQKWIPPDQPAEWIYRKDKTDKGPNPDGHLGWGRFSDAVHVAVRLVAPADVYINGEKIASLPAGEHLVEKPGARPEGRSNLGYPLYSYGPADFGFPKFEVRRAGAVVFRHEGELEITPFVVPGCWNVFARRAPDEAWSAQAKPENGRDSE